jgi:predicted DNA-binding helix-hairpin-helix protein
MSALKEYFNYSKNERRGIFILLIIIMFLMVYRQFIPGLISLPQVDCESFRNEVDLFLKAQEALEKEKLIEINAADTAALISLPGIGPYFAKRILKYRDLLGGYYTKKQLLEVYGMDSTRYGQFSKKIIIDTGKIRKVSINQVEFKKLLRHPYFDYELVKCIFNFKRKRKNIRNLGEIRSLECISDSLFFKIKPYVSINSND